MWCRICVSLFCGLLTLVYSEREMVFLGLRMKLMMQLRGSVAIPVPPNTYSVNVAQPTRETMHAWRRLPCDRGDAVIDKSIQHAAHP